MTSDITCTQCGEPITVDYQVNNPSQREPCPKCGSIARSYSVSATLTARLHVSADAEVITYPRILLTSATRLYADGQYGIAVVVAHMACEIAVERKLAEAFAKRQASYLQKPVYSLLNGFNLGYEKLRKLYTALTDDQVQSQPFWQEFMESVTRRNDIIHDGKVITKAEAERSLTATDDLLKHLGM
jgi:hypothetical protein